MLDKNTCDKFHYEKCNWMKLLFPKDMNTVISTNQGLMVYCLSSCSEFDDCTFKDDLAELLDTNKERNALDY